MSTASCFFKLVRPLRLGLRRSYNATIDASSTTITKTTSPREKQAYENLVFGRSFSDHMLEIDWDEKSGWQAPVIKPYGDLVLSPASTALHYGIEVRRTTKLFTHHIAKLTLLTLPRSTQCFEGMKAYKDAKGQVRLFRPDCNMERMNFSMVRLAMPSINGEAVTECIKKLLRLDSAWVPDRDGYSMYLRPTAIGTSPFLGVHASENVKLFVIMSPVGPYYKDGFVPVKLYADTDNVRAWPGGVGNAKVGGNYGPSILPSKLAAAKGCNQVLWLFGDNHEVTEVGAMNIFFVLRDKRTGKLELTTAPLTRGDILPGVTRRSILELARGFGGSVVLNGKKETLEVTERWLTMGEVAQAAAEGNLVEAFGAGTAVVISPVKSISYKGSDINVPTGDKAGPLALKLWTDVTDIQYGRVEHKWSVVV